MNESDAPKATRSSGAPQIEETVKAPQSSTGNPEPNTEASSSLDDIAAQHAQELKFDEDLQNLNPDERQTLEKKLLTRRFLLSAKGFWRRDGDRLAWLLSGCLLLFVVGSICAQYGINVWNRHIFDALEKRDAGAVMWLSAVFFPLAATAVTFGVINVFVRMSLQRRWRAWLTDKLLKRWLNNGHYYQLNLISGDHDNPEYRMAEDLRIATDAPVDFVHGLVTASLSALTFIVVLWTLGGSLTFTIGRVTFTIPGFLVIAAILYAAIASGLMVRIARSFVSVSEAKNKAEADFRYQLIRIRENGESIALLGGEEEERAGIDRSFVNVLVRWRDLCKEYMKTSGVSQISGIIAPVVPIILASPKYLSGELTLGQMMQAASAFSIVQNAFGWLEDNYPRLAEWNASARRVASLMVSLDGLEDAEKSDSFNRIRRKEGDGAALTLNDLCVSLDDGTAVVGETEVSIRRGERVLIAGESGTGKSTLVRAIAGLWPWGSGSLTIQKGATLFLLPQRPYVPTGSLRRAAAYPGAAEDFSIEDLSKALKQVGLEQLIDRIEEEAAWDHTLSGGEKQRLTLARVLLHKPDIIVMDESTSALDPKSQELMMKIISEELAASTIISVGHRPELEQFHSRKLTLERRPGGAKLVKDILLAPHAEYQKFIHRFVGRLKKTQPKSLQAKERH